MMLLRKLLYVLVITIYYCCQVCIAESTVPSVQAGVITGFTLPDFLPEYYENVFIVEDGSAWERVKSNEEHKAGFINGKDEWVTVEYFKSDRTLEDSIFDRLIKEYGEAMKGMDMAVLDMNRHLLRFIVEDKGFSRLVTIYSTPVGVYNWEYGINGYDTEYIDGFMMRLDLAMGRHRYEEAISLGNVAMGYWSEAIHYYAKMIAESDPSTARIVYEEMLKRAPSNYEAHYEYMRILDDPVVKKNIANILFKNVEDPEILNEAAEVLGKDKKQLSDYPVIGGKPEGLITVLIPLEGCNPWLLDDAAELYTKITGIPVIIRRIPDRLDFGEPERFSERRYLEKLVKGLNIDISDINKWTFEDFKSKIFTEVRKTENPFIVYNMTELFNKIEGDMYQGKGQWDSGPNVEKFQKLILPYRTEDVRTMYVGITGRDLFNGDSNFVFSTHDKWTLKGTLCQASILSYARMLSERYNDIPSKKRLIERIAKELVPATLKSLGIPRSIDPGCPYSYASGLDRLDEKTLELSENVKEAIEKVKY